MIGPATETLPAIADDASFDFAFVDADKANYLTYYEECVRLLRPGGLLMLDNVFMSGRVLEPSEEGPEAIAELNERVAADDRVEAAVLGIADGVTLARKR